MTDPAVRHIAISVATYRRPEGLRNLIDSLNAQVLVEPAPKVEVVIVDNDPGQPCVADPALLVAQSFWPLRYLTEPRRGIVRARNRGLEAVPESADAVAFLDDDETVGPNWLQHMISTLTETRADAVQGPVRPVFEDTPPQWVRDLGFFELGPFEQGAPLNFASTNNSVVRMEVIRVLDLRFDLEFNETGGEDEEFFHRLLGGGYRIAAATSAVAYDVVPARRMTTRWHFMRARRMGNTLGRIALKHRQQRGARLAKGLGHVVVGLAKAATLGAMDRTARLRALTQAARGLGTVQAFLQLRVREYSASSVARDRRVAEGAK